MPGVDEVLDDVEYVSKDLHRHRSCRRGGIGSFLLAEVDGALTIVSRPTPRRPISRLTRSSGFVKRSFGQRSSGKQ
jgi:hypothetical protein